MHDCICLFALICCSINNCCDIIVQILLYQYCCHQVYCNIWQQYQFFILPQDSSYSYRSSFELRAAPLEPPCGAGQVEDQFYLHVGRSSTVLKIGGSVVQTTSPWTRVSNLDRLVRSIVSNPEGQRCSTSRSRVQHNEYRVSITVQYGVHNESTSTLTRFHNIDVNINPITHTVIYASNPSHL